MNNQNKHSLRDGFFPRFIDRTRLVGMFEMDEFILAFGLMFTIVASSLAFPNIGSLTVMLTAFFAGFGFAYLYKKFKRNKPNGFTLHYLYKIGVWNPYDNKVVIQKYKYLKNQRPIPYGFTKEFYN